MAERQSEPVWQIERLAPAHEREAFECGEPSLDDFIRRLATQYDRRDLGRTFVAVKPPSRQVDGFYTISTGAVAFATLPDEVARRFPRHPIPIIHLGRLAVAQSGHGQGLGELLLLDALRRSAHIAAQVGVYAVEVHALSDAAKKFYLKYGFVSLKDDPTHLFIPIKTIRRLEL